MRVCYGESIDDAPAEHPIVTIWEAPRATIRRIVATDARRWVNPLFFLYGATTALRMAPRIGELTDTAWPVAVVGVAAGLANLPGSHLSAWVTRWFGARLGGVASRRDVAAVMAWSGVPSIVGSVVIFVAQLALFGTEIFSSEQPTMAAASPLVTTSFWIASLVVNAWSGTILLVGFAEVNRFSLARAIATYAIIAIVGMLLVAAVLLAAFTLPLSQ